MKKIDKDEILRLLAVMFPDTPKVLELIEEMRVDGEKFEKFIREVRELTD